MLDFCEAERDSGKPAGADLREGKVTLPTIHALRTGDGRVAGLFRERRTDEFRAAVSEAGSLSYTVERAEATLREAASFLEGMPEGPGLQGLGNMGTYVAYCGRKALKRGAVTADEVRRAAGAG